MMPKMAVDEPPLPEFQKWFTIWPTMPARSEMKRRTIPTVAAMSA